MIICPECNGARTHPQQPGDLCPTCKGRGRVLKIYEFCYSCEGSGKNEYKAKCLKCGGDGYKVSISPISSEPVAVPVTDVAEMIGPLIDLQVGDLKLSDDEVDVKALTLAGALVGYSQERTEQGFPPGWFLNNILKEGGMLVLDASGIWHVPEGSELGVQIVQFPVIS